MKTIRLFGDLNYGSGYNTALRGLVQALETIGYTPETLRVIGVSAGVCYREFETGDWLANYIYQDWPHDSEDINLVMTNPGMVDSYWTSCGNRYNIAYCAWETDRLPKLTWIRDGETRDCVVALNQYAEVWVPTTHVKNVFEQSGVTAPIHVVRHALLRGLLAASASKLASRVTRSASHRDFYTIGSWNARKNVEGLIRAYFAVGWNVESPVHLACHCVPATRDEGTMQSMSWIAQEGAKNLYMSASNAGVLPPFGLLTTARSYEEMYAFHRQHNIFVTASRGEGFCIPIVEALAFGNQVIASGPWLNDLRTVVLDDGSLVIVPVQSVPITPMPECRGYELDHRWWEPDVDKLVAALRVANGACDPRTSLAVREHYSPAAVGPVLAERLTSI